MKIMKLVVNGFAKKKNKKSHNVCIQKSLHSVTTTLMCH